MATLEDYREKARERQRRFAARQAEARLARMTITLPADLLAELDRAAAALTISRNEAIADAVRCWVRPVGPGGGKPEP